MSAATGAVSITDKHGRALTRWVVSGRSFYPGERARTLWWLVAVGATPADARTFALRRLSDHRGVDILDVAPGSEVGL
jgi:hypothetical protein